MTQFKITEADIRNLANSQSFDRGYRYYRNQAVANVVQRTNIITAEIEGSGYEPYQVQITLNDTGIETTFCSCLYDWGGICKHIVAALLVLVLDKGKIEEKPELAALLADYTAVQQIAGDQWLTIKPILLQQLSKSGRTSHKIDIYLHEKMLTEAMKALDKENAFVMEADHRKYKLVPMLRSIH